MTTVSDLQQLKFDTPDGHPRRICILAHVGNKNLGDEAIFEAVLRNIRRKLPEAYVWAVSIHPEETSQRHGIEVHLLRRKEPKKAGPRQVSTPGPAQTHKESALKALLKRTPLFPVAKGVLAMPSKVRTVASEVRFLLDSYKKLRGTDLIIVAGSGQVCDHHGGAWGFPYTLWKWTRMGKLAGARVAYMSVGTGPLKESRSRKFAVAALSRADYRTFRDPSARALAQAIGVSAPSAVVPDLAYSHNWHIPARGKTSSRLQVKLNPVPFFDGRYWHEIDEARYADYLAKLAVFGSWAVDMGHELTIFPTQLKADPAVVEDIFDRLTCDRQFVRKPKINGLDDVFAEVASADLVVANRYHGVLLSLYGGVPVIGLAYQNKTTDLMDMVGQRQFAVDASQFTVAELQQKFKILMDCRDQYRRTVADAIASHKRLLETQYDLVFGFANSQSILPQEETMVTTAVAHGGTR